jgi:hypothetical protein
MKKKSIILALLLVICLTITVGGLSSCKKSLHEYWDARLEDGTIHIYGLTKKGKEQETLFLPEYIKGYKVELLRAAVPWLYTGPSEPDLGNVKHIIIEGSVTVGTNFFTGGNYLVIEFLNTKPPTLQYESILFFYSTIIIPDKSPEDYIDNAIYTDELRRPFYKSEAINGYLVRNDVYMGYFGDEKELAIPEMATQIYKSNRFDSEKYISIKIPSTIEKIQKVNMFSDRTEITIYVPEHTIIEDGAFAESATIVRY